MIDHATFRQFATEDEAMTATVWCEYYKCKILPNVCQLRKTRNSRRKWIDMDMAIVYEVCEKCEVFYVESESI